MTHPTPTFPAVDPEGYERPGAPILARDMVIGAVYSFDGLGDDGRGYVLPTELESDGSELSVHGWWLYSGEAGPSEGGGEFLRIDCVWPVR